MSRLIYLCLWKLFLLIFHCISLYFIVFIYIISWPRCIVLFTVSHYLTKWKRIFNKWMYKCTLTTHLSSFVTEATYYYFSQVECLAIWWCAPCYVLRCQNSEPFKNVDETQREFEFDLVAEYIVIFSSLLLYVKVNVRIFPPYWPKVTHTTFLIWGTIIVIFQD